MPTPVIATSTRYFARGVSKLYFLPSVANKSAPTRAEMNSGVDLSPQVADLSGFSVAGNTIDTPDLATTFDSKIAGTTSAEDSSVDLYASIDGVDVRVTLPRTTTGAFMWCDGGDVPGRKADVFPIVVTSNSQLRSTTDAAKRRVSVAITSEPAESVTIPA